MNESGDGMDTMDVKHVAPGSPPGSLAVSPPEVVLETEGGARITVKAPRESADQETARQVIFDIRDLSVYYGSFRAVRNVTIPILENEITALIGPSGCGKTTFLRCMNRMNDLIESARIEGTLLYHGVDLYGADVDPVEVRRRIGMVFQKPNPFPKSIFDNVAFGPKIAGYKGNMQELVEESLHRAALWDEVKDKLKESGLALSGGQQQRLCIARAIATKPDVILMDEPCSSLDPIATAKIEDLMQELVSEYTIVIVTHNMQQAARVSDRTAFFTVDVSEDGHRTGTVVEFDRTETIFTNPADERTEAYVTGRFG
jgi:phosphate transport system ATP-binding protein